MIVLAVKTREEFDSVCVQLAAPTCAMIMEASADGKDIVLTVDSSQLFIKKEEA